jgi:Zn-dependent protease
MARWSVQMGNVLYIAAALPAILLSLSLHEFGHAAMATKMGDPTPRLQGRLTLNPLAHLDPLGTIFIIVTVISGFGFGWGKPVQTNPAYYSNYRAGRILVAIAGPAMNLCLAMLAIGAGYVLFLGHVQLHPFVHMLLYVLIVINIVLMVFNLLPIPPLDGGHVLEMLLPWQQQRAFQRIAPYGLLIMLGLMWFGLLRVIIGFFLGAIFLVIRLGFGPGFLEYLFPGTFA